MNNIIINKFSGNMILNIVTFWVYVTLSSCNNEKSENNYIESKMKEKINAIKQDSLYSGKYGDISIAINGKLVTGVYEFYDNWSEKDKEFLNANVFYFSGKFTNDSTVLINTLCSSCKQILAGTVIFRAKGAQILRIKLSDQPLGYNDVDFTQEKGVEMKLLEKHNWSEIRFVKVKKTILYDKPDDVTARKSYLVKNDFVKILQKSVIAYYNAEILLPVHHLK